MQHANNLERQCVIEYCLTRDARHIRNAQLGHTSSRRHSGGKTSLWGPSLAFTRTMPNHVSELSGFIPESTAKPMRLLRRHAGVYTPGIHLSCREGARLMPTSWRYKRPGPNAARKARAARGGSRAYRPL